MKKVISILLVLSMVFALCACAKTSTTPPKTQTGQTQTPTQTSTGKEPVAVGSEEDIIKYLEDNGYKKGVGYKDSPDGDFIYPEYIKTENGLKTVYLSLSALADYLLTRQEALSELSSSFKNSSIGATLNSNYGASQSFAKNDAMAAPAAEAEYDDGAIVMPSPVIVGGDFVTSEYESVNESGFLSVKTNPLSTFSADVDTASYTNIRAILRENVYDIIPVDEKNETEYGYYPFGYRYYGIDDIHDVRIEEMLNYFKYTDYVENDSPFGTTVEIADTPWNSETKLMVVNVKAKELEEESKGSNLVFLIDTSGSMDDPQKLPLLKESIKLLIGQLTDKDTVSIVTYSGDSALLIDGAKGEKDADKLIEIIDNLVPYGSTNGSGGIEAAYKVAEKYKDEHSNSRIIMCSDGDLNVGITSKDGLEKLVTKEKEKGVYLTILGFGLGNYKDSKMETLADKGNGNYFYIDNIKEGYKVLVEDITSTLLTVADDVKFQIEFNPEYVKAYRKIGYENRDLQDRDFNDDTKDAGEVGYGHEVTVVYELVMADSKMEIPELNLKYQNVETTGDSEEWATFSIRYKNHGESESNLIQFVIDGNHYTEYPTENWKFISDVVGFGLLLNESAYCGDLTLDMVDSSLHELDLEDIDKIEFISVVDMYREFLDK